MKLMIRNLLIILLFTTFNSNSQITITTNNLKVNNVPITNNTISFSSNQSETISLNVHLQTSDGSINNIFGNLFLYYQKDENDSPTQIAFQSTTFYLNTYYMNDTPFEVTLNKGAFFENGGILYAEYKSNANKIYQSSKIQISNGSLTKPEPQLTPTNESISTQNIKYTDNFPVINSKIFVTPNTPTFFDLEVFVKKTTIFLRLPYY